MPAATGATRSLREPRRTLIATTAYPASSGPRVSSRRRRTTRPCGRLTVLTTPKANQPSCSVSISKTSCSNVHLLASEKVRDRLRTRDPSLSRDHAVSA